MRLNVLDLAVDITPDDKTSYYRHYSARGVYVDCKNVKQKTRYE